MNAARLRRNFAPITLARNELFRRFSIYLHFFSRNPPNRTPFICFDLAYYRARLAPITAFDALPLTLNSDLDHICSYKKKRHGQKL